MKRAYTQMRTYIGWLAKRFSLSPEQIIREVERGADAEIKSSQIDGTAVFEAAAGNIELGVMRGDAVHLFLPGREFCDWIVSCVTTTDLRHADIINELLSHRAGVAHFPTDSGLLSFCFMLPVTTRNMTTGENGSGSKAMAICRSMDDGIPKDESWLNSRSVRMHVLIPIGEDPPPELGFDDDSIYRAKLICGLGMYINCFPETLVHGFPEDLKHPSHHQHAAPLTIAVTEKVRQSLGGTHDSPTPHFRAGHFRVLKSEKFTKKRFQVVFVREAFVNGRAKTVLAPEEVQG